MPQYDNELSGVLFKNQNKSTDKHPEYKGQAQVRGEEFWLSVWINAKPDGTKYMKLAFEPKSDVPIDRGGLPPTQVVAPVDDDDIPF